MVDFISSVFSGVTANTITRVIESLWGEKVALNLTEDAKPENKQIESTKIDERVFQTFHIKNGFEGILNFVSDPIVHMVIEDHPTTAWHLVVLVVESRTTGEWYVSQKGEMAFEGSGGGLFVAETVVRKCKERRIPVAGWVISREDSDDLSSGKKLWTEIKSSVIPLMSYSKKEYFVKYIAKKFNDINT